ncbi:MAG: hypothetical protein QOC68_3131 [Solirubrobacteraceae bacterium]|nr:hypothetical protein [Solirubrobacteraceae bacterium]
MSLERTRRVAWAAPALAVALLTINRIVGPWADVAEWIFDLGFVFYAAVGALIVRGHPRNPVGWLFCLIGVGTTAGNALSAYSDGSSASTVTAWFEAVAGVPVDVTVMLAVALFPTGHYLSRRWRRAGITVLVANAFALVVVAFEPGPLPNHPRIRNPLGLDAAAGLLHALAGTAPVIVVVTLLFPIVAVVDRFRRSRGLERQQLKWLALAAAYSIATLAVLVALDSVLNFNTGTGQVVAGSMLGLVMAAPPAAAAMAILRHGLYDIDVVINRTLVYGALTATLAAAYLVVVLLFQLVLQPLTPDTGLAVAASTLAVAALFRPARARIQAAVDRRFYRRRYDATQTLAAFSGRLRDQIDLDALSAELRVVTQQTMQPEHVSLWLRSER